MIPPRKPDGVQEVIWLSHPLDAATPAYGGGSGLSVEPLTQIEAGDTANTLRLSFPNHLSTHVDVPAHFFSGGATLSDYSPYEWVFLRPELVDVDITAGELVRPSHIPADSLSDIDLLLIRTGYEAQRHTDAYWAEGPGLSAELAGWIRGTFPSIRAVGMDLISITSRLHRDEGREAHQVLLGPTGRGDPVLLIEDMALAHVQQQLDWVLVSPLRIWDADGSPATVWGFS